MAKNPNNNCLENMRCPKCGSYGPFEIAGRSTFVVYDDGTDGHGDIEWDDDSYCICIECYHEGKKRDFIEPFNTVPGHPSDCGCALCIIARESKKD